jgi:MYXO-CTERM domain-containing protein
LGVPRLQLNRLPLLLGPALLSAGLVAQRAQASCAAPAPAVVWSYPKDGDVNIPTNVTLWLLLSNWQRPGKVLLDGKEVPVNGFGVGYQPLEPMAPSSPHELTVVASPPGEEPVVSLSIKFTTASGETERESPAVPTVPFVTASPTRPLSTLCQSVVHAMDCFDTGQDTHVVFASDARPFVWIIERVPQLAGESPVFTLWPGECGQPEVFLAGNSLASCYRQYRLHALEGTGLRAMSKPFCPAGLLKADDADGGAPPDQPPPAGDDAGAPVSGPDAGAPAPTGHDGVGTHEVTGGGGCSVGGGSGGGALGFGLGLMLVALRRRQRRR